MLIQCRWVFLRIEIRERVGGKRGASQSRSISIHPSTSLRKLRFAQGTRPALICSLAPQDDPEGFGQDIYIQPEGPVADVALVQGDALFVGGVVADGDLPKAGDVLWNAHQPADQLTLCRSGSPSSVFFVHNDSTSSEFRMIWSFVRTPAP